MSTKRVHGGGRKRTGSMQLRTRGGAEVWHAIVTVDVLQPDGTTKPKRQWYSLETCDKATAKRKLKTLVKSLAKGAPVTEAREEAAAGETLATYVDGLGERLADGDRANLRLHV